MATTIGPDLTFLRVVVRKDLLKTIQKYRFKKHYDSVSDAIRALIAQALLAEGEVQPADGVSPTAPFEGAVPLIRGGVLLGWSAKL